MHLLRIKGWVQDLMFGIVVFESASVIVSILMGWAYTKYQLNKRQDKANDIARAFVENM